MEDRKISNIIIGAGAIGLSCASQINSVEVFEKNPVVGRPIQCSGIVTDSINEVIDIPKKIIVNKISRFDIHWQEQNVEIRPSRKNLIIDRAEFDKEILQRAEKDGAKVNLGFKYIGNDNRKVKLVELKTKREKTIYFDNLIGADGPFSLVAKNNGIYSKNSKRSLVSGIQYRATLKKPIDKDTTQVFLEYGDFSWIIPENENIARIGTLASNQPRAVFEKFIKERGIKQNIKKIVENQSGVVPYYNPKVLFSKMLSSLDSRKRGVFLVGDSACMIKNTTGGGLYHGLKAAGILADCINRFSNSRNNDESANEGAVNDEMAACYDNRVKKEILKDLKFHYSTRSTMNKFKKQDWERAFNILKNDEIKGFLENYDRDQIGKQLPRMLSMVFKEPKLLYFLKYISQYY